VSRGIPRICRGKPRNLSNGAAEFSIICRGKLWALLIMDAGIVHCCCVDGQVHEETPAALDSLVRMDNRDSKVSKVCLVELGHLVQKDLVETRDLPVHLVLLDRLEHLAQQVQQDR